MFLPVDRYKFWISGVFWAFSGRKWNVSCADMLYFVGTYMPFHIVVLNKYYICPIIYNLPPDNQFNCLLENYKRFR